MPKKPDLSELFQMLAEEKAKNAEIQKKKKNKSKKIQKDFMEAFSSELKKLKEDEKNVKNDITDMKERLVSAINQDEEVEEIVEEIIVDIPESPVEPEPDTVSVEEELVAETPLQEEALKYLNTKRQELTEEQVKVKSLEKQIQDVKNSITSIRLGLQGQGGGGISKLSQADDIDKSTALVNNKFLKYDSSTGKFVGADASGGGAVDLSAVDQNIVPATTETYDLGTTSKRWNDLFLAGETIDLGGTKISKDSSGDVSFKDSSNNLKKVIVEELHIGTGSDKLKLTRGADGKLKALDDSDAKTSHDVAFSEITGTPTTISGYGITDAFDGAYSSLTGTPTLFDGAYDSLSGKPTLFDGAYSSLTGTPTIPTVSNDFTDADHTKLDGIEASADVTDTANVTAAGALMDSEVTNLAEVKAFDSSDYATAAQGAKADSALQSETNTTLALSSNTLTYTDENGTATNIDLSAYLDEDSRAIASGTLNSVSGVVTFTRDDASTFTLDLSDLLDDTNLVTSVAGKNGVVTLDADDIADASTTNKFTTAAEITKLAGIEASADVTDATNVTAAGALMDSEVTNLAEVKAFDSSDYATAAQGVKADSAIQSGDLSPYATLANPTLTGTPAAPTAATGTDTTQIATTAFVKQEIDALKALLYAYDQS